MADSVLHVCASCGAAPAQLSVCEACHNDFYCGGVCQRAHWKIHKLSCGVTATARFGQFMSRAVAGDAYGQFKVGYSFKIGLGVPKDVDSALLWFRRAAAGGNSEAQTSLGACYATGDGVPQSRRRAVTWLRRAALAGDVIAQCRLGLCFELGDGVAMSPESAAVWYRRAADKGYAQAQCILGRCYVTGDGVPVDLVKAELLLRQAAGGLSDDTPLEDVCTRLVSLGFL